MLLVAAIAASAFIAGAYANLVVVQNIQSLAGKHALVPAPELQIVNTFWDINLNSSTIQGVFLQVTTTAPSSVQIVNKTYTIYIQVSCLDANGIEYTCATGSATTVLPSNMNSAIALVNVPFSPPVDPELIEIHDLSFIVTGTPR